MKRGNNISTGAKIVKIFSFILHDFECDLKFHENVGASARERVINIPNDPSIAHLPRDSVQRSRTQVASLAKNYVHRQ